MTDDVEEVILCALYHSSYESLAYQLFNHS
jgi:hypothetical protein